MNLRMHVKRWLALTAGIVLFSTIGMVTRAEAADFLLTVSNITENSQVAEEVDYSINGGTFHKLYEFSANGNDLSVQEGNLNAPSGTFTTLTNFPSNGSFTADIILNVGDTLSLEAFGTSNAALFVQLNATGATTSPNTSAAVPQTIATYTMVNPFILDTSTNFKTDNNGTGSAGQVDIRTSVPEPSLFITLFGALGGVAWKRRSGSNTTV